MNNTEDNVDPSVKPKTGKRPTARPFNPLEWSLVDKCLIIGCFWLMAATVVVIIFSNYIKHPDHVPFLNIEAIKEGLPIGYFMVSFWALQLITGF